MSFKIVSEVTKRIVAGKLVEEGFHYVADDSGLLVGKKAHSSVEDATAELAGMKGLEEGLAFARAQFPDLSDKAQVAKANVVAEYLTWVELGRPVKEASAVTEAEPEARVATEESF